MCFHLQPTLLGYTTHAILWHTRTLPAGTQFELLTDSFNPNERTQVEFTGFGRTADGDITRYHINGTATYSLRRTGSSDVYQQGKVLHFTSYSATGTTVATLASKRDAEVRIMTILADQIIDQLLLIAEDLNP